MSNTSNRLKQSVRSGIIGTGLNVFLFLIKLWGGFLANSISMINDAFNNLSDMGSSLVLLIGSKIANREADEEHPHGHGRAEYVTSLLIGIIIVVVSIQLLIQALGRIVTPLTPNYTPLSYTILVISIATKIFIFVYNWHLYKKHNLLPNRATAIDSINDVIITSLVLGSIYISPLVDWPLDAIGGLVISAFIFYSGYSISFQAIDYILGKKGDQQLALTIKNLLLKEPTIQGVHSLFIHDYGPERKIATVHAEVRANDLLIQAHFAMEKIEQFIYESYGVELVIHIDPLSVDILKTDAYHQTIVHIVSTLDPSIEVSEFRMVDVGGKPEIIFKVTKKESGIESKIPLIKEQIEAHYPAARVFIES